MSANTTKRKKAAKKKALPVPLPSAKPRVAKTKSEVPIERVQMSLRSRFNPLRTLTPELCGHYIDQFKIGYPRQLALVWDAVAERDDMVVLVKGLREMAISRYDYQIETIENLDESLQEEAENQRQKIEYFMANLTATNAVDEDHRGGQKLLVEQMMSAVGTRHAVHEIVWQPQDDGNLTAELRFTPLWFFERTTGRLRYLPLDGDANGVELDKDGWMVTVGPGLMIATIIAYLFKILPHRDWVTFCEKYGMPATIGTTDAPAGSAQWNAMFEALRNLASDYAAVKNSSDKIETLDLKGSQANLPYEPLVKRQDARIASMWRGGDLSTQSSGTHSQGRGSNRQEDEAEIILDHDVSMIDETINLNLIRPACEYLFGEKPLVRYCTVVPPKEATAQDISVDEFLLSAGAELGVNDALKRYGRVEAQPNEDLLTAPAQDEQLPAGLGNERTTDITEALLRSAHKRLTPAQAKAFTPVRARFEKALTSPDDQLANAIEQALADLPSLLKQINLDPPTQRIFENAYSAALLDGLTSIPAHA